MGIFRRLLRFMVVKIVITAPRYLQRQLQVVYMWWRNTTKIFRKSPSREHRVSDVGLVKRRYISSVYVSKVLPNYEPLSLASLQAREVGTLAQGHLIQSKQLLWGGYRLWESCSSTDIDNDAGNEAAITWPLTQVTRKQDQQILPQK